MVEFTRKSTKTIFVAALVGLALLASILILPKLWGDIRLQQNKQDLPSARQQWMNAGISNYKINFEVMTLWALPEFMDPERIYLCGMNSDTLTVKSGQVVEARELVECAPIFDRLTIEGAFALAENYSISRSPAIRTLEFDPSYGYITRLSLMYPSDGHPIYLRYSNLIILGK